MSPAATDKDEASLTHIGRYVVLRSLSQRARGGTYVAYDASLNREVVIKFVRAGAGDSEESQLKLRSEAQAMAQLSHPHTVAVYEVGTHEGQVFIVMERVVGRPLTTWIEEVGPDYRETLAVMMQAGEGLAAAHAVGLVHRDFKPSHVMVGDDGRVRVADFAMARMHRDRERTLDDSLSLSRSYSGIHDIPILQVEEPPPTAESSVELLMGTPQYASPEQFQGVGTDDKSDQFSFCVTLYRALYGCRPFTGNKVSILAEEVTAGKFRPPPRDSTVPGWLWPVIARGLDPNPQLRWPSMQVLLLELSQDPEIRRRRWLVAGTLALGLAVAFTAGTRFWPQFPGTSLCQSAENQLEGIWDSSRRGKVEQAMLATQVGGASDTWARTKNTLNSYAQRWVDIYEASCEAFLDRGEPDILAESLRCMERRRQSLSALVDGLAQADVALMREAVPAAAGLPRIEVCRDAQYLKAQVKPPDDLILMAEVSSVRSELVRAAEMERLGRYEAADPLVQNAMQSSQDLAYLPVRAEVLLQRGRLDIALGRFPEAEDSLRAAYVTARKAQTRAVAGRAATHLAFLTAYKLGRIEEGWLWADMASLELEAQGTIEDKAFLERRRAAVALAQGDAATSVSACKKSLALILKAYPADHPEVALVRQNLGIMLQRLGAYQEAERELAFAIEIWRQAYGPRYSRLSGVIVSRAFILLRLGRTEEALQLAQTNIHKIEVAFGRRHPDLVQYREILALTLISAGQIDRALEVLSEALDDGLRAVGKNHPWVVRLVLAQGQAWQAKQAWDKAEDAFRSVIDSEASVEAWAKLAAQLGLAERYLAQGDAKRALSLAEQALVACEAHPGWPEDRARAEFAVAQAVQLLKQDPSRATRLARRALKGYRKIQGTAHVTTVTTIERWLEDHITAEGSR